MTGGAGYIGSFMTKRLLDGGFSVMVVDSLERGDKSVVDERAEFAEGNLLDKAFVKQIFSSNKFEAVIHFAAYISMAESMEDPGAYFEHNTLASLNLLEGMKNAQVSKIVFSSTAGVYGNPTVVPIPEDHIKSPTNPYGESKRMVERLLSWYYEIFQINCVALRYFNASGATLDGSMGENHNPETHIIPNAIKAALSGGEFSLFGTDYDTPDGTAVRDYIHVLDLVEAHVRALERLSRENGKFFYNVGTGKGYSNREVLQMVEEVSGKKINVAEGDRRSGDAAELVADSQRIREQLDFEPKYSDLRTIVESAWKWHNK